MTPENSIKKGMEMQDGTLDHLGSPVSPPDSVPPNETIIVENKYFIRRAPIQKCYHVFNLEKNNTYTTNPYDGICDCPDFRFRTQNGTCKHIKMCRNHVPEVKAALRQRVLNEFTPADLLAKQQSVDGKNGNDQSPHNESGAGIPSPSPQHDSAALAIIDIRDEHQILEEMKGRVLDEYFYEFVADGRHVVGISYAGTNAIARRAGNIHVGEPVVQDMGEYFIAKVPVKLTTANLIKYGVAVQQKTMKLKTGAAVPDRFALNKAVSKAMRNAIRQIIPEEVFKELYKEWKERKGLK